MDLSAIPEADRDAALGEFIVGLYETAIDCKGALGAVLTLQRKMVPTPKPVASAP